MRIDDLRSGQTAQGLDRSAGLKPRFRSSSREAGPVDTGGHEADAVEISNLSRALQGTEVNSTRMERLRQAVANGSFEPDSAVISRKLVDEALQYPA